MSDRFSLRPAAGQDALPISEVYLAAWGSALSDLPKVHSDEQVRTWIRDVVLPGSTAWVAESNGEVAGFFSLDGESIEQMYVHPDHQNSGVGTALLEEARRLSPKRLQLHTFARNTGARRFYERQDSRPSNSRRTMRRTNRMFCMSGRHQNLTRPKPLRYTSRAFHNPRSFSLASRSSCTNNSEWRMFVEYR